MKNKYTVEKYQMCVYYVGEKMFVADLATGEHDEDAFKRAKKYAKKLNKGK